MIGRWRREMRTARATLRRKGVEPSCEPAVLLALSLLRRRLYSLFALGALGLAVIFLGLGYFVAAHSQSGCKNARLLARVETSNANQAQANSHALVKSGVTFGLSPKALAAAVAQNDVLVAQRLAGLKPIARASCTLL